MAPIDQVAREVLVRQRANAVQPSVIRAHEALGGGGAGGSRCCGQLGPIGGRTNPSLRSWALLVERGQGCPCSTCGVNVRIEGPMLHLWGSRVQGRAQGATPARQIRSFFSMYFMASQPNGMRP